jgi:hypothetical protein
MGNEPNCECGAVRCVPGEHHEPAPDFREALADARMRFANLADACYALGLYAISTEAAQGRDACEAALATAQ